MSRVEQTWKHHVISGACAPLVRVVDVSAKALKVLRVEDGGVIGVFEQGWDRRDSWHAWCRHRVRTLAGASPISTAFTRRLIGRTVVHRARRSQRAESAASQMARTADGVCGRRQAVSGNCARWLANGRLP